MIARNIWAILIMLIGMYVTHLLYDVYTANPFFQLPTMYGFYFGMKISPPNNTKNATHD